ncbi:unnamed protein product [Blepharisma stoltei]|uniref:START domain-containing protein n=1 Tax=Blepharisma stoltei TaxID=1481888 RepID=A0AAU9IP10_9CILI|nr:unnamed protein product [Blepharisma stoltei]
MEDWVSRSNVLVTQGLTESDQLKNGDWHFEEEKNGIKIYTKPYTASLVAGKGESEFARSAEEMFNFISNWSLETRWGKGNTANPIAAPGPLNSEIVAEEGTRKLVFVVLPMKWPISNREFIYISDTRIQGNSYTIIERSLEVPEVPLTEGCVRANLNMATIYIDPISDNRCKVTFLVQFDPSGDIPDMVKGKIQKGWAELVPAILHQHTD